MQWKVSTSGATAFTAISCSDFDHLQLHGQQRGKRQPVRGRLQQQSRHFRQQPRHVDGGLRAGGDHQPGQPVGQRGQYGDLHGGGQRQSDATVQWQVSTSSAAAFSPISGATSTTYSFTPSSADNGNQYEAVFTNTVNSATTTATTTAATLTVDYVTTQPAQPDGQCGQHGDLHGGELEPRRRRYGAVGSEQQRRNDLQRHQRSDLDHLQLHGHAAGKTATSTRRSSATVRASSRATPPR